MHSRLQSFFYHNATLHILVANLNVCLIYLVTRFVWLCYKERHSLQRECSTRRKEVCEQCTKLSISSENILVSVSNTSLSTILHKPSIESSDVRIVNRTADGRVIVIVDNQLQTKRFALYKHSTLCNKMSISL